MMMRGLVGALAAGLLSLFSVAPASAQIVGGQAADPGQWPFFVAFRAVKVETQTMQYFCGGSLIAEDWVVTAAHCVVSLEGGGGQFRTTRGRNAGGVVEAVVSPVDIRNVRSTQVYQVARIVVHPEYRSAPGQPHDIALVRLGRGAAPPPPVIELAAQEWRTGAGAWRFEAAGFGATEEGAGLEYDRLQSRYIVSAGSVRLMAAELYALEERRCAQAYADYDAPSQLCFGIAGGGRDSCQGDSGGPLVARLNDQRSVLIGIVSFGRGCARADAPGVYTSAPAHLSWIRSVIGAP